MTPASRLWLAPAAMALATLAGLVAALLGAGAWDAAAWALLAGPLLLCAWRMGVALTSGARGRSDSTTGALRWRNNRDR